MASGVDATWLVKFAKFTRGTGDMKTEPRRLTVLKDTAG